MTHVHSTSCNHEYDNLQCHFCGEYLCKDSYDPKGNRHYLSDCRPDLIAHDRGEACTWPHKNECYLIIHGGNSEPWEDGPMV